MRAFARVVKGQVDFGREDNEREEEEKSFKDWN